MIIKFFFLMFNVCCFLCLLFQSFWGKFGERVSHKNSDYIYDANQFIQYAADPTKTLSDFYIIDEKTAQVQWSHAEGFVPENFRTNIFLAIFTTAWGRLKLYELLDMLDDRVLYYDTGKSCKIL